MRTSVARLLPLILALMSTGAALACGGNGSGPGASTVSGSGTGNAPPASSAPAADSGTD